MPARVLAARASQGYRALVKIALDHDVRWIVEAVLAVNDNRKRAMALGRNALAASCAARPLPCSASPKARHRRYARSAVDPLVTGLLDMGAKVRAFDPVGMEQARRELPDITYCEDAYACADGADALVIVTEWVQFRALDLDRLKGVMKQAIVVDLRNIYRPEEMIAHGFVYESVGRGSAS